MNFMSRLPLQLQAFLAVSLSFPLSLSCYAIPMAFLLIMPSIPRQFPAFHLALHTKSLKLPNFCCCCCCSRYTICIIEQQTGQRTGCPAQAGNKLNEPKKKQLASENICGTRAQRIRHTLHRVYQACHAGIALPYRMIFWFWVCLLISHKSHLATLGRHEEFIVSLAFAQQQSGNASLVVLQTSSQSVANLLWSTASCCRKTVDNGNAGAIKADALLRLPLGSGPKLNSLCRQASISLCVCLCASVRMRMCVCACACRGVRVCSSLFCMALADYELAIMLMSLATKQKRSQCWTPAS